LKEKQTYAMRKLKVVITGLLFVLATGLDAQDGNPTIRITDVKGETTEVSFASSSSSSSCNSPDFPAIRGGERTDISFNKLKYITIMPYKATSNEVLYISAELEYRDGTKEEVEMSRHIRFSGKAGNDDFSIPVTEISMVQVSG